jgi:hypothetical protein
VDDIEAGYREVAHRYVRPRLPRSLVAEILGVSISGYGNWVTEGFLDVEGAQGCTELQAARAAVLSSLIKVLGAEGGRLAYAAIREEVPEKAFGSGRFRCCL